MHDTGVYQIVNLVNGHRYVGSALRVQNRWRQHLAQLEDGRHHSRYLQRAWKKYGDAAFVFRPLVWCGRNDLIGYEQAAMDAYAPEYNIAPRAGSQLGYKHTLETRRKMSEARRRNPSSPRKGMRHTEEAKRRMSEGRKGKGLGARSEETRAKISAALSGRTVTAEHRAKISTALSGRKQSESTIAKRVQKLRGRAMPAGFAEAQRNRMLGRQLSEVTRARISASKSRVSPEQVTQIRSLLSERVKHKMISDQVGVSRWTVAEISCGRRHKGVS